MFVSLFVGGGLVVGSFVLGALLLLAGWLRRIRWKAD